jgi:hypothetical protein
MLRSINNSKNTMQILNNAAFSAAKKKLMHYALELSIPEWSATKRMADDIKEGKEEEFNFDPDKGWKFGFKLPSRYCLPCRHWMYTSVVEETPLLLSLFYPHWYLNSLAVLYDYWIIA